MDRKEALSQWREMKFGLFIHWGIYSLLERGEWVMYGDRIPIADYEKVAARFNPVKYDPREWVRIAKDAGMRYIVITAKHHDGFSMFKTKVSPFNIVDATPYKRDTMAELAEACREGGVRLGFYYSHVREWRHPMAQSFESQGDTNKVGNYGNFWDYPEESRKNLQVYIDEFDIPQLKELLTQYGDILTIWFDTPSMIRPDQAAPLRDLVYEIQPACLVNSRLCEYVETDYLSSGDNEIPAVSGSEPWETCMTMGRAWGYAGDGYFGSSREMIRSLANVVSKGGNFLLNVGPSPLGEIPGGAQTELAKLGSWLRKNGEAIYGTSPSPFKQQPSWGKITRKQNKLYLFVYDVSQKAIALSGLYSKVLSCKHLATGAELRFTQEGSRVTINFCMETQLEEQSELDVIALSFDGELRVNEALTNADDGSIVLPMTYACLEKQPGSRLSVSFAGVSTGWLKAGDSVSWDFLVGDNAAPGEYRISLKLRCGFWGILDWDHEVEIRIAGQTLQVKLEDDGKPLQGYQELVIHAGSIRLEKPGTYHGTVTGTKIGNKRNVGLNLLEVILTPGKQ
ncbi:MAG: alpha-L-fucosidase [Treponema sp.]|jgi:alpha-L-fucosidase|nr:alpha-L-fucosidase [Treponema sp.]